MSLRARLVAGLRLGGTPWAEDLARLYALRPGERLVVEVRRSEDGRSLDVRVDRPAPSGAARSDPA